MHNLDINLPKHLGFGRRGIFFEPEIRFHHGVYVCYNLVGCCIQFAMVLLLYQVETLALVQLRVEMEKH